MLKKIITGVLLGILTFFIREGQTGLYGLFNLNPHHLGNILGSIIGSIFIVYIIMEIIIFFRKRYK